jgi:hypothetical protein
MAPPKLTATNRYIHPEIGKIYNVDTIASYLTAVTRAELNAGLDLSDEIAETANWAVSANRVPVPDLGKKFISKIAGRTETGDASLTFYASRTTTDVRSVLNRGHVGNIVLLGGGDVAGQKMDVYPYEVAAVSKPFDVSGGPALIIIELALTKIPAEDLTIPA